MTTQFAVLFDVDGVLVDAADWHFEALNLALEPFGATISHDLHETELLGLPTRVKLARLVADGTIDNRIVEAVLEARQRHVMSIIRERCRPDPQKIEMLKTLRGLKIRLAAVSNAVRVTVLEMLDRAQLTEHLDVILSSEDVSQPKPNPEPYVSSMRLLRVQPQHCLAVEDGTLGVQAASAAGIRVLRVNGPQDVTLEKVLFHLNQN